MTAVDIGGRLVGPGQPCFVIAEAGVNHNGSTESALELVEGARRAGADCVKFQTFSAERVATGDAEKAPYQQVTTSRAGSQIDMLRELQLPSEAWSKIKDACVESGIMFLSTPVNREDVDFLDRLGVAAYKIASFQIVEPDFLASVARKGKPLLVSTGMATLAEVDLAVRTIRDAGNDQIVLLQCTTNYPSPVEDANLRALNVLRDGFGVPVGYSDHTDTPACCVAAVALGAVVLEKHITLDKSLPGPDHSASADPAEFRHLVDLVRQVESALGTGRKEPSETELANRPYMRRSVVAGVAIPAGALISPEMLTVKRPGTGISPAQIDEVSGARARVAISVDSVIHWHDIER